MHVAIGIVAPTNKILRILVVDPFVQNLSSLELWRLKFVIQRLMGWLVVQGISGFGKVLRVL